MDCFMRRFRHPYRMSQIQLKKHQEMVQKSWDAQRLERDAERERQREEENRAEKAETAAAAEREREIAEAEQKKRYIVLGVGEISNEIHC